MVSYKFKTRSGLSEITANHEFQEACFDSIRSGSPLMVPIEEQNRQITCLEYILDAVSSIESSDYIDVELFENLAHSTIDLNQNLCHIPYEDNNPSTCIPKIIDSYVAVSRVDCNFTGGRIDAYPRLSNAMKTILIKYPNLIQETTCRPHSDRSLYGDDRDYITCFEKLLKEGHRVDFIDVNQMPDRFFDIPMCHESEGHGITTCYKKIIDSALSPESSASYRHQYDNAERLLHDMILSKKLERQLYTMSRMCGDEFSCLEKMLYPVQTKRGSALVKTLFDTYSDSNGVIDTESEFSPFSGEKCRTGSFGSKYENCLNTAVKTVSKLLDAYDGNVRTDAAKLGNHLALQPQFSNECGSLKFLSLVATVDTLRSRGYSDHTEFINKIAKKSMYTYHYLEPLRKLKCMSDVGTPHQANGVDYALELGIPVNYQILQNRMSTPELLKTLTQEPCASIRTGEDIPCLQKLVKELLVDYEDVEPKINDRSRAIIETILNAGGSEVFQYVYPEGGAYFTDYLTGSIFHAITVNAHTSANAIELLELMIRQMGNRFGETGNPFISDTYPRFRRIIDIMEEAPRRYPRQDYKQKFSKPSDTRYILNGCFTRTKEDAKKALESGLFGYGLQKSIIEVLSQWFDEYKDSPEILDLIVQTMGKTKKKTLIEFFKSYNRAQQGKTKKERDIIITPQVNQLFEYIYKKPMDEYFKPSLETRILYDELCFSSPKADDYDFLQEIYDDVEGNSELRADGKGIVGVYDVSVGDTGMWGSDHILRYAGVISRILYGSPQSIGEPYIIRKENMHPVPTGLIEAVNLVSELEFVGKRADNIKGALRIEVHPGFLPAYVSSSPDGVVRDFRDAGNDFVVYLYYVGEDGIIIEHTKTHFKMLDALQKLPKKLKKKLQAKYPHLFGQLDAVIAKEVSDIATVGKPSVDTYKLVISNKPTDIIRASGCQQWDKASCMALYGGSHNMSLRDYLDSGSYIAYLTKKSEYEPQWLARLFMHKCTNCNCVSIQDRLRYYEIEREESRNYPNWHILYDAVKTALADKGVNNISRDRACTFSWGRDIREEIEERGDERCNNEMEERMDECVRGCEDNCEDDSKIDEYSENVSDQVQEEINERVTDALKDYIDEDGEYTISEREKEKITEGIENEVRDDFENDLIQEEIQECKDGCNDECEDVNDEFDCFQFLANAGLLDDEDSEVWTDSTQIQSLMKDSPSYKSILLERTGQTDSSLAFVKQSKTEF